jgi:hypothetical protein
VNVLLTLASGVGAGRIPGGTLRTSISAGFLILTIRSLSSAPMDESSLYLKF